MAEPDVSAEIRRLSAELAQLTEKQARTAHETSILTAGLDAVEDAIRQAATATAEQSSSTEEAAVVAGEPADQLAVLDMRVLTAWVDAHVARLVQRKVGFTGESGGVRWCQSWWQHPEAIARFEALRRAWEEFVVQPGAAMSVWFRDHFDPCMRELTAATGPFHECSPENGHAETEFLGQQEHRVLELEGAK